MNTAALIWRADTTVATAKNSNPAKTIAAMAREKTVIHLALDVPQIITEEDAVPAAAAADAVDMAPATTDANTLTVSADML